MTRNIALSLLLLFVSVVLFELTDIDTAIQDYFYSFDSHQWILDKYAEIPRFIFYDGVKKVYILFVLCVFGCLLFFRKRPIIANNSRGLLVVLLSCIVVPLIIALLKAVTNVPCPSDIEHYGGSYPYVRLFSSYPADFEQTGKIRCYPAGHASGGFALMSLFFLFSSRRKKIVALTFAVAIGWTAGIYKMIIGDHFFSHTFVTMVLAWLIISIIHGLVQKTGPAGEPSNLPKKGSTCTD